MRFDPNGKSSEWLFALRHPVIAFNIGRVIEGRRNMNISTTAVRFAINLGLKNPASAEGEGTQVNAMRHALWTSLISSRYGTNIAREAVRSHEEIEMLAFGDALQTMPEEQLTGMVLGMRWVADSMCDYLNNEIALQRTWDNMPGNEICSDILDIYHDTGLWIAVAADNGFMLYKERLSDEQYMMAKECLKQLDAFGFVIE